MNRALAPVRTRWAAIGAAVAITLGAGGIGITHATTDSGDGPVAAFFPIDPCRLVDAWPDRIASDTSLTFDGWGDVGEIMRRYFLVLDGEPVPSSAMLMTTNDR